MLVVVFLNTLKNLQVRFHTKPLTVSQKLQLKCLGEPNAIYSPLQPLGKNTIGNLFKKGAIILNLSKPKEFGAHSLHALFIQKLANDPSVLVKETM